MWVEKYRPGSLSEYRGASNQKKELKEWLEGWDAGDEPVLLHGQAGTGKTSLVEALASDMDLELVETNASDVRTKSRLKEELKEATRQASFFGKRKLILVDEVDGMAGNADRGGTSELSDIVDGSRFPVVMTANDAYDDSIRTLKNKSKLIELGSVHTNSINAHLKQILENEGIEYEESAVKKIARRSGGQIRSAINDLEAAARGSDELTEEDIEVIGARDGEQDVFEALKMIFKTENASTARRATDNLDEDAENFMQWVRENIPREYERSRDVSAAYEQLSMADLFNGRIRETMNWSLLKYVYHFTTVGVALSKEQKYSGWTRYQFPSMIRKMGSSKATRSTMDSVQQKLGEKLHISGREVRKSLPFISRLIGEDQKYADQLDLDEEELELVRSF
ncbi:MAG: replication factor C large subunit [Candidatus Nanohaloarchaea archaeon]